VTPRCGHRHQRLVVAVGVEVDAVFQRIAQVALHGPAHRVDLLEALVADQADVQALALRMRLSMAVPE
jgi:hypothetical protein